MLSRQRFLAVGGAVCASSALAGCHGATNALPGGTSGTSPSAQPSAPGAESGSLVITAANSPYLLPQGVRTHYTFDTVDIKDGGQLVTVDAIFMTIGTLTVVAKGA